MVEEKQAEKKEEKKEFAVVQVPIEHRLAIRTPEGDVISDLELLAKIANDIEEIKKGTIG
jgi:hypothetical protein